MRLYLVWVARLTKAVAKIKSLYVLSEEIRSSCSSSVGRVMSRMIGKVKFGAFYQKQVGGGALSLDGS